LGDGRPFACGGESTSKDGFLARAASSTKEGAAEELSSFSGRDGGRDSRGARGGAGEEKKLKKVEAKAKRRRRPCGGGNSLHEIGGKEFPRVPLKGLCWWGRLRPAREQCQLLLGQFNFPIRGRLVERSLSEGGVHGQAIDGEKLLEKRRSPRRLEGNFTRKVAKRALFGGRHRYRGGESC